MKTVQKTLVINGGTIEVSKNCLKLPDVIYGRPLKRSKPFLCWGEILMWYIFLIYLRLQVYVGWVVLKYFKVDDVLKISSTSLALVKNI